jgi:hypothetical protein
MKIKDLIKHFETLDQEKELVIIATDSTGWDYGHIVDDTTIELDEVYPSEDNGLEDYLPEINWIEDDITGIECYVIRLDV